MDTLIEEFGQAILTLAAGALVVGLFVWVLNEITVF